MKISSDFLNITTFSKQKESINSKQKFTILNTKAWDNRILKCFHNNTIQRYVTGISLDAGSQMVIGNHIWATSADSPLADITIRKDATAMTNEYIISNNYLDDVHHSLLRI